MKTRLPQYIKSQLPKNIEREILKVLRGKRAQMLLSRQLGFSFNQVYLWETGRRTLYWEDFKKICIKLKIPLFEKIKRYLSFDGGTEVHFLLQKSILHKKKKDFAKELGVTTSKLSRWMTGYSDPSLLDVLRILYITEINFFEFLDDLVGQGKLESIQQIMQKKKKLQESLFLLPFAGAVAPVLNTKKYQSLSEHKDGVIAKMIGITLDEEKRALKTLKEGGQIEFEDGKYKMVPYQINMVQERERFLRNCQYWSERAVKFRKRVGMKSGFGYRTFAITEEGYVKIKQATVDYYNAISEILQHETGPYDHVVAINFHSMILEEDT